MNAVQDSQASYRRGGKSATAFRTISEAANELDLPQHVLRFWESKFPQIRPMKRGGGRRYYRPEDMDLLRRIRSLLYDDGMTIRGVQKVLREPAAKGEAPQAPAGPLSRDEAKQLLVFSRLTPFPGIQKDQRIPTHQLSHAAPLP